MRERDINRKMFHRGHYEVIAKRFKDELGKYEIPDADSEFLIESNARFNEGARVALIELAFSLARRLEMDNSEFDVELFLSKCSPDGMNLYTVWMEAGEAHG